MSIGECIVILIALLVLSVPLSIIFTLKNPPTEKE